MPASSAADVEHGVMLCRRQDTSEECNLVRSRLGGLRRAEDSVPGRGVDALGAQSTSKMS